MLVKPPWNNCEEKIDFLGGLPLDEVAGDVLDSQSSLSQLRDGDVGIIINPIYVLERCLGRLGLIYRFLSGLVKSDEDVICGLADGDIKAITHLGKEFKLARDSSNINLISSSNKEIKPNTVNVLHAIEGIQGIFVSENEFKGNINPTFFLRRLESAIDQIHPVYITGAHLCYTGIYNYSYGIKMAGEKKRSWFLPRNRGFQGVTGLGRDIWDMMREKNVFIDVKHMSLANRLSAYQYALDHQIPLMATHMSASGLRVKDYLSFYYAGAYRTFTPKLAKPFDKLFTSSPTTKLIIPRNKGVFNRYFNSSQINLMDEEILMIMKTGGIIGLIMDRRVQGNVKLKDLVNSKYLDYIAPEDVDFIAGHHSQIIDQYQMDSSFKMDPSQFGDTTSHWVSVENKFSKSDERKFNSATADRERFCQSIIHIYRIAIEGGIAHPERHICLGSDYDGLIDSLKCVKQADKLPQFETDVKNKLQEFKDSSNTNVFAANNVDIDHLVISIFRSSALNFLKTNFGLTVAPGVT